MLSSAKRYGAWPIAARENSAANATGAIRARQRGCNGCYNLWFGMNIVSRYLLKQHAAPFIFALSGTTGIMLLNQVAKRFGDLVGKGLPGGVIVEVFALSIPFIVAMTLPMAVLVAVLYSFTRLSADNELTALKANGISLIQLMRPLLIAATGIAVVAFLFSDHVLPRSNHRLRSLLQDI